MIAKEIVMHCYAQSSSYWHFQNSLKSKLVPVTLREVFFFFISARVAIPPVPAYC